MEESQIIDVWDVFKEYIPDDAKAVAAEQYINLVADNFVETTEILEGLLGYDSYLDSAITGILENLEHDSEDDEWDEFEDDAEDY